MTESKEKVKSYLGNEPYIFVSYSHKDWEKIAPFIAALQEHYNVWFDEGIHYAKEWEEEISSRIKKCTVFMYLVTKNSLNSQNCKDELHMARKLEKTFLNILVDESNVLPEWFILRYERYQMCKLFSFSSYQDAVDDLAQKCEALGAAKKSEFSEKSNTPIPDPVPQKQSVEDKNKSDSEIAKGEPRSAGKRLPGAKLDIFLKILAYILIVCSGVALVLYFIFKNPILLFACLWTFFVALPFFRTIRYYLKEKFEWGSFFTIGLNVISLTLLTIFPDNIGLRWFFGICAGIRLVAAFFIWANTDWDGSKGLTFSATEGKSCAVTGLGTCSDTTLTIPAKYVSSPVTSVAKNAFNNCTGLKSVVFKKNMRKIGKNAFLHCTGLGYISFSDGITKIEESAFAECVSLTDIRFAGTIRQWEAIQKEPHWDDDTGDYTVKCSDGKVAKDGKIIENNNQ